ncbi:acyl carrier protein [Nocardia otitidiscaviarum]|uniref:Acyl carrier protein n=1 Tax=Nocardia otitidiscaviarum TaxID=1823 RepID=A0A516NLR7_9NOCA|nr:phosphopantetheine-binding protein [Nocardia otitidiscaviarum]MCP9618778.1 phosphopantetheine-binding protein [Nocardia otitidiscaviarum]QDP79835.1 acyl carrier protein [Nocardia otitidiscaviarum]
MTTAMSRDTAETTVRTALRGFAPESYLRAVSEDDSLRATLELDSIDYLTFIERLSAARGARIEEDDYPRLATVRSCVDFLTER